MEQIKILFFVIGSFFGMEDAQIAADKTIVTIDPVNRQIEITQEHLFAVMTSEKVAELVNAQWKFLNQANNIEDSWAEELTKLPSKNISITSMNDDFQARIVLSYNNAADIRMMGIWYDDEKKQFSINHIPKQNMTSKKGRRVGNYWVFDDDSTFSFTLEPFLDLPDEYKKLKIPLKQLIDSKE